MTVNEHMQVLFGSLIFQLAQARATLDALQERVTALESQLREQTHG